VRERTLEKKEGGIKRAKQMPHRKTAIDRVEEEEEGDISGVEDCGGGGGGGGGARFFAIFADRPWNFEVLNFNFTLPWN